MGSLGLKGGRLDLVVHVVVIRMPGSLVCWYAHDAVMLVRSRPAARSLTCSRVDDALARFYGEPHLRRSG